MIQAVRNELKKYDGEIVREEICEDVRRPGHPRIVYDGFPELPGETMMDKKKYLMEHYDYLRSALMLEPRGHRDMFGALLTAPVHEEADYGVIFLDSGGCLNMCGHGSIGTASMLVFYST